MAAARGKIAGSSKDCLCSKLLAIAIKCSKDTDRCGGACCGWGHESRDSTRFNHVQNRLGYVICLPKVGFFACLRLG